MEGCVKMLRGSPELFDGIILKISFEYVYVKNYQYYYKIPMKQYSECEINSYRDI